MKEVILLVLLSTILVACGGATPTPDISAIQTQAVQDAIATMTAQAPTATEAPTNTPTPTNTPIPIPTDTPIPSPTNTATPVPTPTPDEIAQAKNMALRLDELPEGWYQAGLWEQSPTYTSPGFYAGEHVQAAVHVIYRNKKYAPPEEEISVGNFVYICNEPEAAMYYYMQLLPFEGQEIQLGDAGFYATLSPGSDSLMFVTNSILVRLEYYGQPLLGVDSQERLRFLWQLAEGVAKRAIPGFSSMPPFPQESP